MLGFSDRLLPITLVNIDIFYRSDPVSKSLAKDPTHIHDERGTHRNKPSVTPNHNPSSFQSFPNPVPKEIGSAIK